MLIPTFVSFVMKPLLTDDEPCSVPSAFHKSVGTSTKFGVIFKDEFSADIQNANYVKHLINNSSWENVYSYADSVNILPVMVQYINLHRTKDIDWNEYIKRFFLTSEEDRMAISLSESMSPFRTQLEDKSQIIDEIVKSKEQAEKQLAFFKKTTFIGIPVAVGGGFLLHKYWNLSST